MLDMALLVYMQNKMIILTTKRRQAAYLGRMQVQSHCLDPKKIEVSNQIPIITLTAIK